MGGTAGDSDGNLLRAASHAERGVGVPRPSALKPPRLDRREEVGRVAGAVAVGLEGEGGEGAAGREESGDWGEVGGSCPAAAPASAVCGDSAEVGGAVEAPLLKLKVMLSASSSACATDLLLPADLWHCSGSDRERGG